MRIVEHYTPDQGITQSILLDWLACRYRAQCALKDGYEAKARKTSFRFGSLFHDTLEDLYGGIRGGRYERRNIGAVADLLAARIRAAVAENLRAAGPGDDRAEIEDEGPLAEALLGGYLRQWAADDWAREWVDVEGEFDQTFHPEGPTGPAYRLRGKRDAVYLQKPRKGAGAPGLWLMETKTKSQISEDDLDLALAFDFQSLFYLLALEEGDPSPAQPIRGCLYNIVRKPSLRPYAVGARRPKAETRAEFLERIGADIREKPDHYFKRFEIVFPQKVRDEFRAQLAVQLRDFAAWFRGDLPTYRNPTACLTRYRCEFLGHCASGGFAGYARTREFFTELAKSAIPVTPLQRGESHARPSNHPAPRAGTSPARRAAVW